MKLAIIGVTIVVLAVGGFFAWRIMSAPPEQAGETEVPVAAAKPALFAPLLPPLVVNLKDSFGDPHFLQMELEIMSRDQGIIDEVKNHAAVIRNALILIYGNLDYEAVHTREGKEQMLADALSEIQRIVEEETGKTGVEAVYFNSLIIQ